MSTVITSGDLTLEPTLVLGFESRRQSNNIMHDVLGRTNPDVTLRPATLRTGTLELLFISEADSKAAEDAHGVARVWSIESDERSTIEMSYVTSGEITRTLDEDTSELWTLRIAYSEVTT